MVYQRIDGLQPSSNGLQPNSVLALVAMPGAPSSVLALSSALASNINGLQQKNILFTEPGLGSATVAAGRCEGRCCPSGRALHKHQNNNLETLNKSKPQPYNKER